MDGDTMEFDRDLQTSLVAALKPVGSTAARPALDIAGKNSLTTSNKPRQSNRKQDALGNLFSTRECVEDNYTSFVVDSDEGKDLSTAGLPPKRARFTRNIAFHPKIDPSTQHPTNYHPATEHPASRYTMSQYTETQEPALISQQSPPVPQPILPLAPQPTPSSPVQDVHEQSRELHRILSCPADAYFGILSLANCTDRSSLIEISWLDLSFLVHPRRCPLPGAVKALSRVNDAYSWIQKHPGLAQPHSPASPLPPLAQDALSAPKAWVAPSTPRGHTIEEPKQSWNDSGIQTQSAPQHPESRPTRQIAPPIPSGHAMKEEPQQWDNSGAQTQPAPRHPVTWDDPREIVPPPRWTYPPRPSSHIYVTNGQPTIRPAVGWQFRKHGGETRVWYQRRWRALIQNRPDFQSLYVDKDGWIMPIMSGAISENQRRRIQGRAELEFNTHP